VFSTTLICIISPCQFPVFGQQPIPIRIASRADRGSTGLPLRRNLAARPSIEPETARRRARYARADHAGHAEHLAAAHFEGNVMQLFSRKVGHGEHDIVRCRARHPRAGPFSSRATIMRISSSALVSPISRVPMVSPSRNTVTRSQTRKISLILLRHVDDRYAAPLQLRGSTGTAVPPSRRISELVGSSISE